MFSVAHPIERLVHNTVADGCDAVDTVESESATRLENTKGRVRIAIDTFGEPAWRDAVIQQLHTWHVRANVASRAYHKMYDIIRTCVLEASRSAHLCEAPGGFVQACIDSFPGIVWRAQSVANGPTFHGSLPSDRIRTGDLLDHDEQQSLVDAWLEDGAYDLVTGDGAAAMDHEQLEQEAYPLCAAQWHVALRLLAPGGAVVLKLFEINTLPTMQLVAQAAHCFDEVSIIKPLWSRPTNSERYLVAMGFDPRRATKSLPESFPRSWAATTRAVIDHMNLEQIKALDVCLTKTRERRKRRGH